MLNNEGPYIRISVRKSIISDILNRTDYFTLKTDTL